jgi:hypothetical protein
MNKLYTWFKDLGLTNKKILIAYGIVYGLLIIGSIFIPNIPREIFWVIVLLFPVFIISTIFLFLLNTLFTSFYNRLSLFLFILFVILVYIIWSGIFSFAFCYSDNKFTKIIYLMVIIGIDVYLNYKFLWNIYYTQIKNRILHTIINSALVITFFSIIQFNEKININNIFMKMENEFIKWFCTICFIHYGIYCLSFIVLLIYKRNNLKSLIK